MPKNKFRFIMTPNAEQHEAVKAYAEKKGLRIVEAYQELTAHGLKSHELTQDGKFVPATAGALHSREGMPSDMLGGPSILELGREATKPTIPMNPDKAFRASSGLPLGPVPRKVEFRPKKGQK